MQEIFKIEDRYKVFREGSYIDRGDIGGIKSEEMINMIVGREMGEEYIKKNENKEIKGVEV